MPKIIGIDLGTSTSEASVMLNGKITMIQNDKQEEIIPSVIGLNDDDEIIVGTEAADRFLMYPDKTAIEIKRKMGSDQTIPLGNKKLTPVEASAQLLSYIKNYASEFLNEEVTSAVVTVPAYFNDQQRKATIQAGESIGLKIERIINEPTAAALCYGIDHLEEENHILVYDLGGGTFDVTLLEIFDGVLEVKASSGDNALGGKDFDECLIHYLLEQFHLKTEIHLENDIYAMVKLKEAAMACKIALSSDNSYDIIIPLVTERNGQVFSIEETITKDLFEHLIQELVERTKDAIDVVLLDSGLLKEEIDLILLVGGSTKIPFVKKYVKELMGQEPANLIHPELSISMGAAIQAAMLSNEISGEDGILITDVNPYALGVRILVEEYFMLNDDYMDIIIPRNVTIPVTKKKIYTTFKDYQTVVDIQVYQGEQTQASKNNFLGNFLVKGIPAAKADKEKIEIQFSYNTNGILEVTATIISTGESAKLSIDIHSSKQEEINVSEWKNSKKSMKYRSTIRKAEKILKMDLEPEDEDEIQELIYELKKALVEDQEQSYIEEIENQIIDLLEEFL